MLLFLEKGTTGSNTLIVLFIVLTYHHRFFHFHIEMLFDIIYGRQNGQIGIALTTAWSTYVADCTQ